MKRTNVFLLSLPWHSSGTHPRCDPARCACGACARRDGIHAAGSACGAFGRAAMLLVATTAFTPPQAPSVLRHRARVSMSGVDLGQTFRRAEVWSSDTATLADVINVVGRWESCSEWRERTEFREDVEKDKLLFFEDPVQPYTRAKYEMSVRLGSASP